MNIVFLSHPLFLKSQSMPRFVAMLAEGMQHRGHTVEILRPASFFSRIPVPSGMQKWLGYIDQFIIFPFRVRRRMRSLREKTLFVFTDHALGPWVPLTSGFPNVIHCHDFLAQHSANRMIPQNPTRWSGRMYQRYIRSGYRKGLNFISVSEKTRTDLHSYLTRSPHSSTVVYNGLNRSFKPVDPSLARQVISQRISLNVASGYILHVGGNQWYKNRIGVIEIYNKWRSSTAHTLPLLMIGRSPDKRLSSAYEQSPFKSDIFFIVDMEDQFLPAAYSGATVFLFPSIAEGFGWPVAEAMACACPVITTNSMPMTEVAGEAAALIPVQPFDKQNTEQWACDCAEVLEDVVSMTPCERFAMVEAGQINANRFNTSGALDQIEKIYDAILNARENGQDTNGLKESSLCPDSVAPNH